MLISSCGGGDGAETALDPNDTFDIAELANNPLIISEVEVWPEESSKLKANKSVNGELVADEGTLTDGTPFILYDFEGKKGDHVTLSLNSDDFDAYLVLVDQPGRILAYSDDADPKADTDAEINYYLPASGFYQVFVNSNQGKTGEFELAFDVTRHENETGLLTLDETVEGWLNLTDETNEYDIYVDNWSFVMPDEPVVVWMASDQFDTMLSATAADGTVLERNDDESFVGRVSRSRLYLEPTDDYPAGTEVTLHASMPSPFAIGGRYELYAATAPSTYDAAGVVQIRPIFVQNDSQTIDTSQYDDAWAIIMDYTQSVWNTCNISVEVVGDGFGILDLATFPDDMHVAEGEWTRDEEMLQLAPDRLLPYDGVITVYIVPQIDSGFRYGVSYPSTRYAPRRSGMVVLAQEALTNPEHYVTLAHEIGHILGVGHPDDVDGDGDPYNDTPENVMSNYIHTGEGTPTNVANITPLQCITARAAHHFIAADEPLIDPIFGRIERTLPPSTTVLEALTTQDELLDDEYFVDVFFVRAEAGDVIQIDLDSADFDPYLILQNSRGDIIAENDDNGNQRGSRIVYTVDDDDDFSIGVSSYLPFSRGSYELTVLTKDNQASSSR